MNNLRKVCKKNSRITGIIIIVIGVLAFLIWGRAGIKFLTAKTIDENTQSLSDYEGKLVTFHMTECWDWYEDITNPNGSNFTGWVTYNMTDKETGDGFWFGVWRKTKYDDEMENLIYETRQYFGGLADEPKGATVKGYLLKMDSEDKSYFDKIMGNNSEKREYYQIIEGYLDDHGSKSITFTLVFDCICLAIVAVGVIVFLIGGIGWDKKLKTYVQMHPGLTMDMLEGEAGNGTYFMNGAIIVGSSTLFYANTKANAIDMNNICWGYHFMKRGKNPISQMIVCDINGKSTAINCSEPIARDTLNCMAKKCPWIIVGYKEDWDRMYKRSLDEFLRLHYYDEKQKDAGFGGGKYVDPFEEYERQHGPVEPPKNNDGGSGSGSSFTDISGWMDRNKDQ